MNRTARRVAMAALLCLGLGLGSGARAVPITYTVSGVFSGTYSAGAFTDALVTITASADTANLIAVSPGVWAMNVSPATFVTIASIGHFQDRVSGTAVAVFDIQSEMSAGFDFAGNQRVGTVAPSFATYGLNTAIGPVSGTPINFGTDIVTDFGILRLTRGTNPTTFTAVSTATPVPEPSTLALLALALPLVVAAQRRRRGAGPAR